MERERERRARLTARHRISLGLKINPFNGPADALRRAFCVTLSRRVASLLRPDLVSQYLRGRGFFK